MRNILLFFCIVCMSGWVHFCIYMSAYNIQRKYNCMHYKFKYVFPKECSQIPHLYAFPKVSNEKGLPYLLTIDGEKWAMISYPISVFTCYALYQVWGLVSDLNAISRFTILWCGVEGLVTILSFWIHRAANRVIDLSKRKVVLDVDIQRHIRRQMHAESKIYPTPQYSCEIVHTTTQSFLWVHEDWSILIRENDKEVINKHVATKDHYRYCDCSLTQLNTD